MKSGWVKWVVIAVVVYVAWRYVQSKGGLGNMMGGTPGAKKGKQPASQMTG